MMTKGKKWNGSRVLSAFLACLMIVSNASLPVQAAEPSAEITLQQENTPEQPDEQEQQEKPGTEDGDRQPGNPDAEDSDRQPGNPGTEDGDRQPENPDAEDDEEQPANPGTENGEEQPDEPETPDGDDRSDTEGGEDQKDTEDQPEDPDAGEKNPAKAPLGEEDPVKVAVSLSGITMDDKEYDGEAAAYTGTPVLKDAEGQEVSGVEISLSPSYAGTLADGSVYEKTESAPSQAGEYTLTFTLAGTDADQYALEEAIYNFKITPKEVRITAYGKRISIGAKLPAVSTLRYGTEGLLEGDALLTPPSFRYSPENISTDTAGEYEIVPFGADAGNNYSIAYENGTLQVREEKILYSGTTNNISWKIDQNHNLTIEGTGDYDYTDQGTPPWCEYSGSIYHATVKVTGMTRTACMFSGCRNLRTVDLEDLDMSNVTSMNRMFENCQYLETLDLSSLNTSNVTNMHGMFMECIELKTLNLNGWDTSNVTDMGMMFWYCNNLKTLGLSGWDTSNVTKTTDMDGMFQGCWNLESLDLSSWDVSKVTDSDAFPWAGFGENFLRDCSSLKYIRTPKFIGWINLPAAGDGERWYDEDGRIYRSIPAAVTGENNIITLTRKKLNGGKINDITWEIDENGRLTISGTGEYYEGEYFGGSTALYVPWSNRSDVLSAVVNVSGIRSTAWMFYGCSKLNSIDLSGLDTSKLMNMEQMFANCSGLETLDLSGLDTSNVSNMGGMFDACSSLKTLDLNGLDTSNVSNMDGMFGRCSSLEMLNLDGLDTRNVSSMNSMFGDCSSLKTLDLSGLDTSNVGDMSYMFSNCSSLEMLNLNGLDTSNVGHMNYMFSNCSSLKALDLSGLYLGDVSEMGCMFQNCSSLKTLNLDIVEGYDYHTRLIGGMFEGCSELQSLDLSKLNFDRVYNVEQSFLSECGSLSYIKTPKNFSWEVSLPGSDKWYDENGTEYTQLPCGLADSIDLYRGGEPDSGQKQYAYVSGVTVESRPYDGNALTYTGTPEVTDASGNPVSGVTLSASYTGTLADGSEYTMTDQAPSQAGTYRLSFAITGAGEESYILRKSVYSFQITKRQVTITAPDRTIALGGQVPSLSSVDDYTVDGLLTGEQLLKKPLFKYGKADISTQKPGSCEIIPYGAKVGANYRIKYVSAQLAVGEINGYDLAEAEIIFSDIEYDGSYHEVHPIVQYREWRLDEGTDYRLDIMQRMGGDWSTVGGVIYAGEYRIRITGIGFYYGEQTKTFHVGFGKDMDFGDILPEDIPYNGQVPESLWIAVDYGYEDMYTGKAIRPAVRVYDHTTRLKEKTDYTVSYANNVNANVTPDGSYLDNVSAVPTITVTGKGNYSGSMKEYFDIHQCDLHWTYSPDAVTVAYTGKAQKPQPVFWSEFTNNVPKSKDYTAVYYRKEDTQRTEPLSAVQEEGEYIIQCTGKGRNYAGVAEYPLTVTKLKLVGKLKVSKIPNQPYTGSEICPQVAVKDGKTTLTEDVDYSIEYYNNTEVGTGELLLVGKSEAGYTGERRITFKITGTPIKKAAVTGLTASVYSGTQHKPEPVLTMKKTVNGVQTTETLQKDRDYTLSWQKNENTGTATVVITGIGGYTGTVKKSFKIQKYNIASNTGGQFKAVLEDSQTLLPYAKGGVKAKPVVTFTADDGSELILEEGKDYTLSYRRHTKLTGEGTDHLAEITVKGKGNFSGTYQNKLYYEIVRQDIGQLTLTAQDKVYKNKKNIYATKVTVTDVNGKALKAGTDYDKAITYTYANPTEVQDAAGGGTVNRAAGDAVEKNDIIPVGTVLRAKVTAKEGGNYFGSLEGEYRITKASIASASVSVPKQTYTGQPVTLDKSDITVKVKGQPVADDQWEIVPDSYKNNVKKGTASVTIRGVDNYGGMKTIKFTIKAKGFLW